MYCAKCGSEVNNNSGFCPVCGASLGTQNSTPQAGVQGAASDNGQQNMVYFIFALLAVNVFTAFTTVFNTFGIPLTMDRILFTSKGDMTTSFSFLYYMSNAFGFFRTAETNLTSYGYGGYSGGIFAFFVYSFAIADVVFLALAVKELISSKQPKPISNKRIITRLVFSSAASIGQLVMLFFFKIITINSKDVYLTAWFYILLVAAVASLCTQIYLLKQKL